ncbi:SpoIVB peptidase [Aneurinibacillus sp. Ricciae_BoGa-3]|uniref:SpoIVB peptidase n=1 Tax=Aneurinibacillus sp. Ricciae_BoGa-3 TaxID=3022697 RepID=UPI00234232DB|nr:SpoIVB peptidase [Aneurinibacillus sp. Ricciae_BoGa-3]WCK53135.1 SpoIVB peptidase [Aneurinibacillus sp. Ricciae_BoGa-3]
MKKYVKTWFGYLLIVLALFTFSSTPFQQFASFPEKLRIFQGSLAQLSLTVPVTATIETSNPDVVAFGNSAAKTVDLEKPLTIEPRHPGEAKVMLKIASIPVKTVNVEVLPELKVIPGGQSIGVQLQTVGVLVVGHHLVENKGKKISPGEIANIKVGDMIVRVNGVYINDMDDVGRLVNEAGKKGQPVQLEVLRGKEKLQMELTPALDDNDKSYRMGLYIRDSAAGVGTMTFYDPKSQRYGALGHVISDIDTGKPITVGDGHVVQSSVTSIEPGKSGTPGEKFATFKNERVKLGNIEKNTPFGIFGNMKKMPDNNLATKPVPVALSEQVKPGPAEIYTVINGTTVEKFKIEIVNTVSQKFPATKGLILRVTDPRLLNKTGGIVQGMSGSPIIQNGRLVGAVTHVFVNDPKSGYGTYIEWMLRDAGIDIRSQSKGKLKAS